MSTELAEQNKSSKRGVGMTTTEFLQLWDDNREGIEAIVPWHVNRARVFELAKRFVEKNGDLKRCSPGSVFQAIVDGLMLGLNPDGIKPGYYVVPYQSEAAMQLSIHGRMELIRNTGRLKDWSHAAVYEGDEFFTQIVDGKEFYKHNPTAAERHDPEKITHVYCVFVLRPEFEGEDDTIIRESWTRERINEHRDLKSQAYNSKELYRQDCISHGRKPDRSKLSPWHNHWYEMAVKTIINYCFNREVLPASTEILDEIRKQQLMEEGKAAIQSQGVVSTAVNAVLSAPKTESQVKLPATNEKPDQGELMSDASKAIEESDSVGELKAIHAKYHALLDDPLKDPLLRLLKAKKAEIQEATQPEEPSEANSDDDSAPKSDDDLLSLLHEELKAANSLGECTVLREKYHELGSDEDGYLFELNEEVSAREDQIRSSRSASDEDDE